jgi:hypothetical protein
MSKKYIATLSVHYPTRGEDMSDRVNNFLKKHYKGEFKDVGNSVGGGTVDIFYLKAEPISSKTAFKKHMQAFLDKFELISAGINYEDYAEYQLDQKAYQEEQDKKQRIKIKSKKIYQKLVKEHAEDQEIVEHLGNVFKGCL